MKLLQSLHWRIAIAYTALILLAMGAVSLYLIDFVRDSYIDDLKIQLEQEAGLIAESASPFLEQKLDLEALQGISDRAGILTDARVTLIAPDGTVFADTWQQAGAMENHGNRPEILESLATGSGNTTRFSQTVERELLYMAVVIQQDDDVLGIARIAVPTARISENIRRIITAVALSAAIIAILSILLAYVIARRTARGVRSVTEGAQRLASGDLDYRVRTVASDETQELAGAFNAMATSLRDLVQDLSEERETLSEILSSMADAVVVIRPNGTVALLNPAARGLLSVSQDDPTGLSFIELTREHDLQRLVAACLETHEGQHGEVETIFPRRYLSGIATPLALGDAFGVLLTLHDLTRIRQVETARKEFVSNVSHELRTPLASVKAMVDTLDGGALEDGDAARGFLQRINGDVDRMTRMVTELLDLSRLESGHQEPEFVPVDLRALAQGIVTEYAPRAEGQGMTLSTLLPDDLPRVLSDEAQLRQVFGNLLDNALRFTPDHGEIAVGATTKGSFVEVHVRDTGVGIGEEHIPHVFERFYKADRSRRDLGTGLGLAIVKHIVRTHGGDVRVESVEGQGSTVFFTLPPVR